MILDKINAQLPQKALGVSKKKGGWFYWLALIGIGFIIFYAVTFFIAFYTN